MKKLRRLSFLAVAMLLQQPNAFALTPVMVGGDAIYDACGAIVEITSVGGSEVRADPADDGKVIMKLKKHGNAYLCDSERNGYSSVVVFTEGRDCGVSSPIAKRARYKGPCVSGWIKISRMKVLAG